MHPNVVAGTGTIYCSQRTAWSIAVVHVGDGVGWVSQEGQEEERPLTNEVAESVAEGGNVQPLDDEVALDAGAGCD